VSRLVIFDCDGVLVDSERIAVRVDVRLIGALGWAITEAEVIERFVGRSNEFMRSEIEERIGRALGPDWDAAYDQAYREAFERGLAPVDGVVEALDGITAPTCIASSGSHEKMGFTLRRTGLWDRFAGRIYSASEVKRGKPAPDLFLHAAERMGTAPADCAVVEDSAFGVEAALAAGMRAFAYAGGVTPAARLSRPGAVVFHDMRELPALLEAGVVRN
jgi:HAD superfamily hydrolase (TIGR01509 family)